MNFQYTTDGSLEFEFTIRLVTAQIFATLRSELDPRLVRYVCLPDLLSSVRLLSTESGMVHSSLEHKIRCSVIETSQSQKNILFNEFRDELMEHFNDTNQDPKLHHDDECFESELFRRYLPLVIMTRMEKAIGSKTFSA